MPARSLVEAAATTSSIPFYLPRLVEAAHEKLSLREGERREIVPYCGKYGNYT